MAKVLLVEDDNNLREIFEMRLQAEGYDTLSAGDGEEALMVAKSQKPDLIIADVMMPKLSGFEMLETLRATPDMNNTKVIMMTALGQAEDRARGEKLGVVKYLVKSQVTLEDFVRVVREVLPPEGSAKTSTDIADVKSSNKQEGENKMDDNTNQNPAPAAGDAPADGQQSSADEQKVVDNQVNDFASGGSAGGDSGAGGDASSFPPASPPTEPEGPQPPAEEPPAGGDAPSA
jgi:CheY-like chemotaxis protein